MFTAEIKLFRNMLGKKDQFGNKVNWLGASQLLFELKRFQSRYRKTYKENISLKLSLAVARADSLMYTRTLYGEVIDTINAQSYKLFSSTYAIRFDRPVWNTPFNGPILP